MKDANSLDPRVNRLPRIDGNSILRKDPLDQLSTFEVFVQPKEGKPFQHEGAVHASEAETAFVFAKEAFTRRFTCTSLWVASTADVFVSPTTEGTESIYELLNEPHLSENPDKEFEVFHLLKRGKQHIHFQTILASSSFHAIWKASQLAGSGLIAYNVWAVAADVIRKTREEEKELWNTLPDKKFRDAAYYKGGDKLKLFLERKAQQS